MAEYISRSANYDKRNILRGRCLVDECDCDCFLSTEASAFCGYCNDPPTKHQNLGRLGSTTLPSGSTTLLKSNSQPTSTNESQSNLEDNGEPQPADLEVVSAPVIHTNSEEDQSQIDSVSNDTASVSGTTLYDKLMKGDQKSGKSRQPWEDVKLRWFENPQRKSGQFYNNNYKGFWHSCSGSEEKFRAAYLLERKREWEETKFLEKWQSKLVFFKSNNSAAAGRYIDAGYVPRKNDLFAKGKVEEALDEAKGQISTRLGNVKAFHETLFFKTNKEDGKPGTGRKLKPGRRPHCNFDKTILELNTLLRDIDDVKEKLNEASDLVNGAFYKCMLGSQEVSKRSASKGKYNNEWKTKKRQAVTLRNKAKFLFASLGGSVVDGHFEPEFGVPQITKLSRNELEDVMGSGDNIDALDVLLSCGVFREAAWDVVKEYLSEIARG